ncbi:MAG TPA: DUF2268 domain-containing putative Zn-dependent protease [Caulobacteraceae bacterium]|nr:DUF2268 domain-containing putative Zn-dependent protease [Caulobacteraceae bacterium]
MNEWTLHWLEAEGDLQPWRDQISAQIEETRRLVSQHVEPTRLDVLINRGSGGVIPEIGFGARAYGRSLFRLHIDPDNPAVGRGLLDGTLQRQVAHEVNHCMRMGGPGYGRTFGETLVSEGLAGHFVRRLFNNPPEPWERAVDKATLLARLPDAATLAQAQWDHGRWFFGTKDGHNPRWLGYTLGYELVGAWIDARGAPDADALVASPAEEIIAIGLPRLTTVLLEVQKLGSRL